MSDQGTFFHSFREWCLRAHCSCIHQWTGVSMGTLIDLRLTNVYSDIFPSESELTFMVIWATVACLLHYTTQARLCSLPPLLRLGHSWPCRWFTTVSLLDHCKLGTPHMSCSFGPYACMFFLLLTHQLWGQIVLFLHKYMSPTQADTISFYLIFLLRFGKKLKHIFYNILTDPFSFYHVSCSLILIVQYCHWVSLNGVNCAIYFTTWNPTVWGYWKVSSYGKEKLEGEELYFDLLKDQVRCWGKTTTQQKQMVN